MEGGVIRVRFWRKELVQLRLTSPSKSINGFGGRKRARKWKFSQKNLSQQLVPTPTLFSFDLVRTLQLQQLMVGAHRELHPRKDLWPFSLEFHSGSSSAKARRKPPERPYCGLPLPTFPKHLSGSGRTATAAGGHCCAKRLTERTSLQLNSPTTPPLKRGKRRSSCIGRNIFCSVRI